jgi:hypothetical protein
MIHQLKIKLEYLTHIEEGKKTFEVRLNDRDYQVGDFIQFLPTDNQIYNSSSPYFEITYVHHGLGMQPHYVILGIKPKDTIED